MGQELLGLDTLPTSNACDPCYTPFFDSFPFRDPHYSRDIPDFGAKNTLEKKRWKSVNSEYERELRYQSSAPASNLEPASLEGSCNSPDSNISISNDGGVSRPAETDTELSDSSSSTLSEPQVQQTQVHHSPRSRIINESSNWESKFIRRILVNTDLMLEEFAHIRSYLPIPLISGGKVKLGSDKNMEEGFKLERKILFDYAEESLELRCTQVFSGSWKSWTKLTILIQRKD
ncbi:hypothetical protein ACH5RR_022878 [Cinchona calisaya]|uniref:Uncharacterized protein n=1 Tax=Cinchona calisaya TaxID=153742 RepID=A0ABD2Z919_9GENT